MTNVCVFEFTTAHNIPLAGHLSNTPHMQHISMIAHELLTTSAQLLTTETHLITKPAHLQTKAAQVSTLSSKYVGNTQV